MRIYKMIIDEFNVIKPNGPEFIKPDKVPLKYEVHFYVRSRQIFKNPFTIEPKLIR